MTTNAGPLVVLGASGFLGAHVTAAAARAGKRPVLATSRRPELHTRWTDADLEARIESVAADAAVPGDLEALLQARVPSAVIVCAAYSRVGDCEKDPGRARTLNRELPQRVARQCRDLGARLIHVSTDLVFGGHPPAGERYAEADPPSPLHVYGQTKADGESLVLAELPAATVVRLPLLFGPSGEAVGASDALLAAADRGERSGLFTDEWRTPLDVRDAAAALVEIVDLDLPGRLHVAGPERMSRYDLGLAVLRAAGCEEALERLIEPTTRAAVGLERSRAEDVSLDANRARERLSTPLRAPEAALRARVP